MCVKRLNCVISNRYCFNKNLLPRLSVNHEFVCVYIEEERQICRIVRYCYNEPVSGQVRVD